LTFHIEVVLCRVSLEPLIQDLSNEIMDLRRLNLFTSLPLHCSAFPGAWNCSSCQHSVMVIWAVELVKITFMSGWEIWVRHIVRGGQGVPFWLCV